MSPCRADTVIGITKPVGRGQCWRHRSHRRQMPSPRPCATPNIILCSPRLLRTQVAITLCLCLDKSSQSTGVDTRHTAPGPSFQPTYLQEPTSLSSQTLPQARRRPCVSSRTSGCSPRWPFHRFQEQLRRGNLRLAQNGSLEVEVY